MGMPVRTYEVVPVRLYIHAGTNHIRFETKATLAKELHLSHVVAVLQRPDPDWAKVEGVEYHHWPITNKRPLPEWLGQRSRWLARELKAGRSVMIYCNNGENRSGLLAAMAIRAYLHCTGRQALSHVRLIRPGAVANAAAERYLQALPTIPVQP